MSVGCWRSSSAFVIALSLLSRVLAASEPPVTPAEPTPEELLALEKALAADAGEDQALPIPTGGDSPGAAAFLPEMAFILDVAGAWHSDEPGWTGGHDPSTVGFNFQSLELAVGAAADPYLRFDANFAFALFGVEIEEAYGTSLGIPAGFQIRAGQFLSRFGRANASHPHAWQFSAQPLAIGKFFGSEGNRGLGVELSWLAPAPWFLELVSSMQMPDGDCCMRSYGGSANGEIESIGDFVYLLGVKQFWDASVDTGVGFGLSGQFGPNPSGRETRSEIYGLDLLVRHRPRGNAERTALTFALEALFRTRQVPDDVVQDVGGFASLVWDIDPEWSIGARYEAVTGPLGDSAALDPLDPEWTSLRQRATVQGTYWPSHFSRIRLEMASDLAGFREAPVWSVVLGLELLVGAHGAHSL